jgi:four helix bundle protein
MSDYKKLQVWRKAHALALNAHRVATGIRGSQYSAFRSQIIRAAMSIPANIVEGREQKTDAGFARFLRIALASTSELEYHLTAARDIEVISKGDYLSLSSQVVEVRMMLHGLLRRLEGSTKGTDSPTGTVSAL